MFKRNANMPLLLEDNSSTAFGAASKAVALYDPDAMTELATQICEGYLTLLTGTCEQAKTGGPDDKEARERVLLLAYASLTDGNVIDACFGMRISSKKNTAATAMIQEAKNAVDEAVSSNERVGRIAVEAYKKGFHTVIEMNKKLSKLNMFTKCFMEKKIRRNATAKLATDFLQLEQAITAA